MTSRTRTTAYIDGSQMLYRAEFGFPSRIINRSRCDVTGLFGFLALTRKALNSSPLGPTHAVIVFDADAPTHRSRLDPRYKAARQTFLPQNSSNPFRHLAWIKRSLEVWGLAQVEHESAEADDVIATFIDRDRADHHRAIVISRDRDFHQVVSQDVSQWDSSRGREKGWITPRVIYDRFGVNPGQWCDYIALVGDRADGMPGVQGIGPVTARRLLHDGRTLDDLETELSPDAHQESLRQRDLHQFDRTLILPSPGAFPLPEDGLLPAAAVLENLGLWDFLYP